MDNVTFFIDEMSGAEYALIDRGNGEYTSMPKSVWDEQQAAKENGTMSDSV
jgi:hypothetical protein